MTWLKSLNLIKGINVVVSHRVHTVILDCAPIGFMDAMGVKTLQQVRKLLVTMVGWAVIHVL